MTHIEFEPDTGLLVMFGHAGAGRRGKDLVCAALSILMETAAAQPGAQQRRGEGWCVIMGDRDALGALSRGFRLLAGQYPGHVSYREVRA